MKKPTIAELQERIKELEEVITRQADMLTNPPPRQLSIAETIMNEIGTHKSCYRSIEHEMLELNQQLTDLERIKEFHATQAASLKESLTRL